MRALNLTAQANSKDFSFQRLLVVYFLLCIGISFEHFEETIHLLEQFFFIVN